jgi:hypothetical protein
MRAEVDDVLMSEWLKQLANLWISVGKDVDPQRLALYSEALGDVPLDLLKRAVNRAIRDNGAYQTVPTISAIWAALRKELGNPVDLTLAIDEWEDRRWLRVGRYFGVPVPTEQA